MGSGASRSSGIGSSSYSYLQRQRLGQSTNTQSQQPVPVFYGYPASRPTSSTVDRTHPSNTCTSSPQYANQPQAPPIGFIPSVMSSPYGVHSQTGATAAFNQNKQTTSPQAWDEKRDLVYTRVLSADEFLGRMEENDETVRLYSMSEERHMYLPKITELLGLRGHLQDELLRIEKMLAEEDPELKCLDEFEGTHGKAVQRLREIHQKAKIIHAVPIPLHDPSSDDSKVMDTASGDLSPGSYASMADTSTQHSQSHGNVGTRSGDLSVTNAGCQSEVMGHGNDLGVQVTDTGEGHSIDVQCDEDMTEEVLHEKHEKEENIVAANYAHKIVKRTNELSPEEMERLLQDHLTSMQALRNRQQKEQHKFSEILENKKRARLLQRRADKQNEDESDDDGADVGSHGAAAVSHLPPGKPNIYSRFEAPKVQRGTTRPDVILAAAAEKLKEDSGDEFDFDDSRLTETKQTPETHVSSRVMTPQRPDVLDGTDSSGEIFSQRSQSQVDGARSMQLKNGEGRRSSISRPASSRSTDAKMLLQLGSGEGDGSSNSRPGSSRSTDTKKHLLVEDKSSYDRGSAHASPRSATSADTQTLSEDDSSDDDIETHHTSTSTSVMTGMDIEEVELKDDEFVKEMSDARKKDLNDVDFTGMVNSHLQGVKVFVAQRNAQNEALHAKMMAKLKEKQAKPGNSHIDVEDEQSKVNVAEKKLANLEDGLTKELINKRHVMTDEELQEMLSKYREQQQVLLTQREICRQRFDQKLQEQLSKKKKKRRQRNQMVEKEDGKAVVSSLVIEHQEKTREIQNLRQREKDKVDHALQDKLMAKRQRTQHLNKES